jgi:diguanylate cyclase (GGDEF)-like protein
LLSVLAFSVPLIGATIAPEWAAEDHGLLLWLTPMLPPFLLTYYRGWGGASIGLAAGMAALVTTNLAVLLLGLGGPNYSVILWVVGTYIMICVGAGVMSELLWRERKLAEEMALTDRLTGLPNHRHAAVFLDAAFSAAARGQPVSVVLFSLDRFEQVSERFGEQTGEQVLRRFGAILTEVTRRMDLSARWNGHEFVSILSRCKAGGAAAFTVRVLEELRADVFPWGKVTASAGIAEFEAGMGSLELLLAAADHARFRAIEAGGDGHAIAGTRSEAFADRVSPQNPSAQRGSLRLESDPDRGFQLVPTPRTDEDRRGAGYFQDSPAPRGCETVLVVNDDSSELSAISGA